MYLAIDMSETRTIRLVLFDAHNSTEVTESGKNADVLRVMAQFLDAQSLTPKDLEGIAVVMGKGTFTSTRLATTVANTIQYVHGTPLLSIESRELNDIAALATRFTNKAVDYFLSVTYSGAPRINIT